jgi:hypothetical protein
MPFRCLGYYSTTIDLCATEHRTERPSVCPQREMASNRRTPTLVKVVRVSSIFHKQISCWCESYYLLTLENTLESIDLTVMKRSSSYSDALLACYVAAMVDPLIW